MDDLAQWLAAQLDEDERIARAATSGPWSADPDSDGLRRWTIGVVPHNPGVCVAYLPSTHEVAADAAHIAEHDPARVLREIDAKRWVVKQYVEHERLDRETFDAEGEHARSLVSLRAAYLDAVRAMATVYRDRPGYREEWAP